MAFRSPAGICEAEVQHKLGEPVISNEPSLGEVSEKSLHRAPARQNSQMNDFPGNLSRKAAKLLEGLANFFAAMACVSPSLRAKHFLRTQRNIHGCRKCFTQPPLVTLNSR